MCGSSPGVSHSSRESQVSFLSECVGPEVEAACADPPQGSLILLEYLRLAAHCVRVLGPVQQPFNLVIWIPDPAVNRTGFYS